MVKVTMYKSRASYNRAKKRAGKVATIKDVKRLIKEDEELKFFDTALSFNFDRTGEIPATGQLALIPQGDTQSTREGRQAVIKSVQIRGDIFMDPGAAANGVDIAYLYLVHDRQANSEAASITDVFTSANMESNLLNLNNDKRFRILKKWVIPLNSGAGVDAAYNGVVRTIEFYRKVNIKMDFSSTTGAITEITQNNIFLMAGALGDDITSFTGSCRLRFVG